MTFFNWDTSKRGRVGSGQVSRIAFRVGKDSLESWQQHLADNNIDSQWTELFNQKTLEFVDYHGLPLALVEDPEQSQPEISGFYGVEIWSGRPEATATHLEESYGFKSVDASENHLYLENSNQAPQRIAVNKTKMNRGIDGVGTVHHLAWEVPEKENLKDYQIQLVKAGLKPTEIKDRNYFSSIYYREPGFTIYEIATTGPGFGIDEEIPGGALMLPDHFEPKRQEIEANLPPIRLK